MAGEGISYDDKSLSKAKSVAIRDAVLAILMIPTEQIDTDAESYEITRPVSQVSATPEYERLRTAAKSFNYNKEQFITFLQTHDVTPDSVNASNINQLVSALGN